MAHNYNVITEFIKKVNREIPYMYKVALFPPFITFDAVWSRKCESALLFTSRRRLSSLAQFCLLLTYSPTLLPSPSSGAEAPPDAAQRPVSGVHLPRGFLGEPGWWAGLGIHGWGVETAEGGGERWHHEAHWTQWLYLWSMSPTLPREGTGGPLKTHGGCSGARGAQRKGTHLLPAQHPFPTPPLSHFFHYHLKLNKSPLLERTRENCTWASPFPRIKRIWLMTMFVWWGTFATHFSCFLREEGISTTLAGKEEYGKNTPTCSSFHLL